MSRNTKDNSILSENTPVRIGLILAFLSVFGAAIFWGASINAKLDSIISFQTTTTSAIGELKAADTAMSKEIADIKLKFAISEVAIKNLQDKVFSTPNPPSTKQN